MNLSKYCQIIKIVLKISTSSQFHYFFDTSIKSIKLSDVSQSMNFFDIFINDSLLFIHKRKIKCDDIAKKKHIAQKEDPSLPDSNEFFSSNNNGNRKNKDT